MEFKETVRRMAEEIVPDIRGGNAAGLVTVSTEAGTMLVNSADAYKKRNEEIERVETIIADGMLAYVNGKQEAEDAPRD